MSAGADRRRVAPRLAADDWWCLHGTLRLSRTGARRNEGGILLYRSKDSTRTPSRLRTRAGLKRRPSQCGKRGPEKASPGGAKNESALAYVFLRATWKSCFHHGDIRTLRAANAEGARGNVTAPVNLFTREAQVRDSQQDRIEALPARNSFRRV